jgi:hypothetical protein
MLACSVIGGMTALGPTSDVDLPLGNAYEDVSAHPRSATSGHSRMTSKRQECRKNGHQSTEESGPEGPSMNLSRCFIASCYSNKPQQAGAK